MKKIYVLIQISKASGKEEVIYANSNKEIAEKDLKRASTGNLSKFYDYKIQEINLY